MVGVTKLCTSEDTAVGDGCFPAAGYEDVVDGFLCFSIRAVPGPVMDPLPGKPSVGDAEVGGSAQIEQSLAVIIGGAVDKDGACHCRKGEVLGGDCSIGICEDDDYVMRGGAAWMASCSWSWNVSFAWSGVTSVGL